MKKLFVTLTVMTLLSSMSAFAGQMGTEMMGGEICNDNGKTPETLTTDASAVDGESTEAVNIDDNA